MSKFVFSADGHIVEPPTLFMEGLPPSLREYGMHAEMKDGFMHMMVGDKVVSKMALNRPQPKPPEPGKEEETFGRGNKIGTREILPRIEDMKHEGVDAEICFPSQGLWVSLIENPEAELASAQIYNNWNDKFFAGHLDKFIRCGILPVHDFNNTVAEIKRLSEMGFTAAMLPSLIEDRNNIPRYNSEAWDPVFEAAQRYNMVMVMHCGTGREDVRAHKGPGGAVINYTIQMCDAQHSIMHLVAGGVLDRFPGVKIAFIENGASWLAGLAERMDEVYNAHHMFVKPKLSILPSEIIKRQVHVSFQYDRACIMSRSVTGHKALMWGADYPHNEGTWPHSKKVVSHLFDGIDISEQEQADIIGGNAARLFRLHRPEFVNG
ncbi:MAG: amidohydrolase family protein [Caulobacterales bacterium]